MVAFTYPSNWSARQGTGRSRSARGHGTSVDGFHNGLDNACLEESLGVPRRRDSKWDPKLACGSCMKSGGPNNVNPCLAGAVTHP